LPGPILVGRENELEKLGQSLNSAFEGNVTTIFISGEAGSGKTRLAKEFLDSAKEKDVKILTSQCLTKAAVPYLPFVDAFEGYLSTEEKSRPISNLKL
jgi:predicted ATPase